MLRLVGIFLVGIVVLADASLALANLMPVNFYSFNGSLTDTGSAPVALTYITGDSNTSPVFSNNVPTGYTGQSLSLDGNGSYAQGTPTAALTAPYTIDTWVSVADMNNPRTFFGTRSGSDMSFDEKFGTIGTNGMGSVNGIHGDIGSGSTWLNTGADSAAFNYATNTWYNVAYVVTASGYSVYLNGILSSTGNYGATVGTPLLYDTTHLINVGSSNNGGEIFSGNLFNLGIYNSALTQSQILSLVPEPASCVTLGLGAIGMLVLARRRRIG